MANNEKELLSRTKTGPISSAKVSLAVSLHKKKSRLTEGKRRNWERGGYVLRQGEDQRRGRGWQRISRRRSGEHD